MIQYFEKKCNSEIDFCDNNFSVKFTARATAQIAQAAFWLIDVDMLIPLSHTSLPEAHL